MRVVRLAPSLQASLAMKWLALICLFAGCTNEGLKPSLEGPHPCGANSCITGQVCLIMESGSQCGVNEDAGIGPYQEYSWTCIDLPEQCDGVPSCDCVAGGGFCSVNGRDVRSGCI